MSVKTNDQVGFMPTLMKSECILGITNPTQFWELWYAKVLISFLEF